MSEFFISTHGVRKGLTDTALKTAESGYLTRRLVDVAQDVIVKQEDCGTDKGYWVEAIVDRKTNTIIESLFDRLVGRYSKQEITDPKTGEVILESDEFITDALAQKVVDAGVEGMYIRSAFTCKSIYGVCKKCYGRNMATVSYTHLDVYKRQAHHYYFRYVCILCLQSEQYGRCWRYR